MQSTEIIDAIAARRVELGMTIQQLADTSGVPKATVDRILRKETPNPSLQNVLDLADAVGYAFESKSNSHGNIDDPYILHIFALYERQISDLQCERNRENAEKARELETKSRRITFLMRVLGVLCCGILVIYLVDITNPDHGWFQGQNVEVALLGTIIVVALAVAAFMGLRKKEK